MLKNRLIRYAIPLLAFADGAGLTWLPWPLIRPAVASPA